jgi:glycogen operon protein
MNMFWKPLDFEVPGQVGRLWRGAIDTFAAAPRDIADPGQETAAVEHVCTVQGRSIVVLVSGGA